MTRSMFLALLIAVAAATALPAQPPQPADQQQSKLVLQETPFSFLDPVYGTSVAVLESVAASANPADKQLYVSPLLQQVPFDADGKVRYHALALGNGTTQFSFKQIN